MSDAGARDRIIALVEALTPTSEPDVRFVCVDRGGGREQPLEARAAQGAYRHFGLQTVAPARDDGQTGLATLRYRVGYELRIAYPNQVDAERMERVRNEDTEAVIVELRNPNQWSLASGIDTLVVGSPGRPPVDRPVGGSRDGAPAVLRVILIDVLYTT